MPILLDFESRSRCDLKTHGGRLYWEHPSTEALCCVLHDTGTDAWGLWLPGDPCPVSPGDTLAAHNAMGFDRFAAARLGWRALDEGPAWVDTSELARTAGLPGALDALGTRWLDLPKDKDASRYTKFLSRPSRAKARAGQLPDVDWDRVVAYCASDVEIMVHGWPMLEGWTELEPDVGAAERAINDRGICFDTQLAWRLLEEDERNAELACESAARALGRGWTAANVAIVARSPAQFCAHTGAENAQADTVAALRHPLARAREALASIASGKLRAGLARVSSDGRLRDSHRYYGAHTGRWSGRGMQLQNMPRPAKRFETWTDEDICRRADEVLAGGHCDQEEIDLLVRACLIARPGHRLVWRDFAGVEARALAWCAGDADALAVFREGIRDPYKIMASRIFGVPYESIGKDERRTTGKIAELACGYGMGGHKFAWTAAKAGSDLAAMGVDAFAVVQAWRDLHAPIVRFWRELERAFTATLHTGRDTYVDRFTYTRGDDEDVALLLPSGRPLVYNDPRVTPGERGPQLSYLGTKSGREHVYGGKLTENAIQALCRDLLAAAMVKAENAGLNPVLHVHDELCCEVPESACAEAEIALQGYMVDLPDWAAGFPIGADGGSGRRYRK